MGVSGQVLSDQAVLLVSSLVCDLSVSLPGGSFHAGSHWRAKRSILDEGGLLQPLAVELVADAGEQCQFLDLIEPQLVEVQPCLHSGWQCAVHFMKWGQTGHSSLAFATCSVVRSASPSA